MTKLLSKRLKLKNIIFKCSNSIDIIYNIIYIVLHTYIVYTYTNK